MPPTANLDQKDKQFVAKVSHSQHVDMQSGHCQTSDDRRISAIRNAVALDCFNRSPVCACVRVLKFLMEN